MPHFIFGEGDVDLVSAQVGIEKSGNCRDIGLFHLSEALEVSFFVELVKCMHGTALCASAAGQEYLAAKEQLHCRAVPKNGYTVELGLCLWVFFGLVSPPTQADALADGVPCGGGLFEALSGPCDRGFCGGPEEVAHFACGPCGRHHQADAERVVET